MSDFLTGSNESISFSNLGDSCDGKLIRITDRVDVDMDGTPRTWNDGSPKKVYLWELDTNEGMRTMWVRGNLVKVLKEACIAAGAKDSADLINARVQVKHHALGEKKKGLNPAKLFQAKITLAPEGERLSGADLKAAAEEVFDPFADE